MNNVATQQKPRKQADWVTDKVIEDQATGLAVEIQKLPLSHPKFSLVVVQRRTDGKGYSRFIHPRVKAENAVVTVGHHGMVIARLMDEATLHVQECLQAIEDRWILQKQMREQADIDRQTGKTDVVSTGKTAREAAKRARHENNLVERRAADAERTSRTKGRSK